MNIFVDMGKTYGTYKGFGASGGWWAQTVGAWTKEEGGVLVKDRICKLLYEKKDGIGLDIFRYNIGAGSLESGKGKFEREERRTSCFEISEGEYDFSRDQNAVYIMKKAVEYGVNEVVLFVNSPPERLTKNHKAHLDKAFRTNLAPENYLPFARFCLDVTEHFVAEGLPVKYLSPVNEPFWKWTGGQEGCHYKPKQVYELFKVFDEEIKKRPALDGVLLSGAENGDIRFCNKSFTRAFLDATDRNDGIDLHSYCVPIPVPFANNRVAFVKRFRAFLDKYYPTVPVKMSEWTHMKRGRDTSMKSALETAKVIWEDFYFLNVEAWNHWIACSIYNYCDGLIYIDDETQSYTLTKRYFVTGNFSKFVPLGAKRCLADTDEMDVKALCFVKDGKRTLIVINFSSGEKAFVPAFDAKAYVTSPEDDLAEYDSTKDVSFKLQPKSVTTFKEI